MMARERIFLKKLFVTERPKDFHEFIQLFLYPF